MKNTSKGLTNGILPSPVRFLSLDVYSYYLNAGYIYKREKKGQKIVQHLALMITKIIKLWKKDTLNIQQYVTSG